MTVIKGNDTGTLLREAIVLDLGDLATQAERLKAAARARAEKIVADAEEEATRRVADASNRGFEQGQAEGFSKGFEEGLAKGSAEALANASQQLNDLHAVWQQAAGEIEEMREQIQREGSHAVLQVALRMAEKLVHRVVEVDPSVIIDQLATSLSHVLRPVDVTVRINPSDRPMLEEAMPELMADFAHFRHIRLVDDTSLSPGGCVVNHGQGRIDASLEKQLQRVVAAMLPDGMEVADPEFEMDEDDEEYEEELDASESFVSIEEDDSSQPMIEGQFDEESQPENEDQG